MLHSQLLNSTLLDQAPTHFKQSTATVEPQYTRLGTTLDTPHPGDANLTFWVSTIIPFVFLSAFKIYGSRRPTAFHQFCTSILRQALATFTDSAGIFLGRQKAT